MPHILGKMCPMAQSANLDETLLEATDQWLPFPNELVRAAICERIECNHFMAHETGTLVDCAKYAEEAGRDG